MGNCWVASPRHIIDKQPCTLKKCVYPPSTSQQCRFQPRRSQQSILHKGVQGFTLIELILVVVILGVLSTYSINRMADLRSEAYESTFENTFDAFKNGKDIYRMQWQVDLKPANGSYVTGYSLPCSSNGYPIEVAYTGVATANGCFSVWNDLLNPIPDTVTLANFAADYPSVDFSRNNFIVTALGDSRCAFLHIDGATGMGDSVNRVLYDMDTGMITKDIFVLP